MVRIAVFSDVHADVFALKDALKQIERLACDDIICLGDLLDYSLFPEETIALLWSNKIKTIRGNHERWAQSKNYASYDLSEESIKWLDDLPTSWSRIIEGVRVVAYHGSPKSDMDGIYPEQVTVFDLDKYLGKVEADALLIGHTHIPLRLSASNGRVVCNPGSLLRDPADDYKEPVAIWDKVTQTFDLGEPMLKCCGTFGILELPSKKFTVHRAKDGVEIEITRTIGPKPKTRRDLRSKADPIS